MKFLPAAGPERTRLTLLLALLGIAGAVWYYRTGTSASVPQTATGTAGRTPPAASASPRDQGRGSARPAAAPKPTVPQALKLAELEQVPNEPEAGRNPFRFGVKYVPPPPVQPPTPYVAPPVVAPQPPPPPEVKLRLNGVMDDPYGKKRAILIDPNGAMFMGVDGQTIDGRYRLVKVERSSAVVEFLDGSGRRTLFVGR